MPNIIRRRRLAGSNGRTYAIEDIHDDGKSRLMVPNGSGFQPGTHVVKAIAKTLNTSRVKDAKR